MPNKTFWISIGGVGFIAAILLVFFLLDGGATNRDSLDTAGKTSDGIETQSDDQGLGTSNVVSDSATNMDDGEPTNQPLASASSAPVFLPSKVSTPSEAIRQELTHVDPTIDGWDTEAFSDRASIQLKLLATAIHDSAAGDVNLSLEDLLHEDFRCVELRPSSRRNVFKDQRLSVDRWERDPNTRVKPTIRQQSEFQNALKALVVPWQNSRDSQLRATFKTVRVTSTPAYVRTRVLAQFAGLTRDGYAQQNAVWTCAWYNNPSPKGQPLLAGINVEEFEEIVSSGKRGKLLDDSTEIVLGANAGYRQQFLHGIDYWRDRLDWRLGLDIVGPHGLAIGDVNGDGLDDLFVCEPGGLPNRLFVQQADGTAKDMSAIAGVDWIEPAMSALLVDMDNDGDQDLLLTSGRLFISCENNGDGTFQQKEVLTLAGGARSIASADYDGDGKLDVYICCYFHSDSSLAGIGLGLPMPYHDANNGPPNVLLKNLGGWKYEDVTKELGLDENNRRFSFAAAWEDYDNDGDVDLYVANDFGRNNLFRNQGGKFVDVAATAGVEDVASGMSVSWGDYNRDGLVDLYIANMYSSAGNRVMHQSQFRSTTDEATKNAYRRLARGNSLFQNNGDGTFRDVSIDAGVNMGRWAWGSLFADLNNDGWEDLLVGNGMVTSLDDPGDL